MSAPTIVAHPAKVDRNVRPRPLAIVAMLCWREWTRFFRQPARVVAALGQPVLFWVLFGTGLHSAFRGGDQDFMTFYLPGTLTLIL